MDPPRIARAKARVVPVPTLRNHLILRESLRWFGGRTWLLWPPLSACRTVAAYLRLHGDRGQRRQAGARIERGAARLARGLRHRDARRHRARRLFARAADGPRAPGAAR